VDAPTPATIGRSTLEALLVACATPVGLWLGWQLTDPSSRLRIRLDELAATARSTAARVRAERIDRRVAAFVRDLDDLDDLDNLETEGTS
jgi:hypothetical protein